MRDGEARLTVDIPEELHRRVRVLAAEHGVEIRELVRFALEEAFPAPVRRGLRQVSPEFMARLRPVTPRKGGKP